MPHVPTVYDIMFLLKNASEIGWFYTPNLIRPMKKNIPTWLTLVDPIEKKTQRTGKSHKVIFIKDSRPLNVGNLKTLRVVYIYLL